MAQDPSQHIFYLYRRRFIPFPQAVFFQGSRQNPVYTGNFWCFLHSFSTDTATENDEIQHEFILKSHVSPVFTRSTVELQTLITALL